MVGAKEGLEDACEEALTGAIGIEDCDGCEGCREGGV